jgi:hypothetical protein
MVAAGGGVRVTSVVAASFAAMSARAGATFISFNRARTCGVRPGKDATGVKPGVWSLPTRNMLASFESRRDCLESMKHRVNNPPDSEYNGSYSEPFGCGYHSNSYWRAQLMMTLYGSGDFACMWRSTEGVQVNAGYGPLLKGYPTASTAKCYCD